MVFVRPLFAFLYVFIISCVVLFVKYFLDIIFRYLISTCFLSLI
nr:MAG TPA: hypothetical protein [Caudoviricetes sp.]